MYSTNYSFSSPKPYHSIEMPKTFPEDIECIVKGRVDGFGSLYISNVEAASNPATLKKFKIQAILSCAKGYELKHPKSLVPHYKYIPTVDHDECDISKHFDEAIEFLHTTLKQTNVLAHCIAGVSRSVSMVLAYFIKHHGMDYEEAYRLVKSKRKIIHPNDGFIRQLKQFSQKVKTQKRNQSRQRSVSSRQSDKSIRLQESKEPDQSKRVRFTDYKSQQLKPYEAKMEDSSSLNKQRSPYASFYDRYNSLEMKNAPPKYVPPRKDNYFQSLQNIPEPTNQKDYVLTPKAPKQQEIFELSRTSTNYFTPNKHLVNQRAYEPPRQYEEYTKAVRTDRPGTSPINKAQNPLLGRQQRGRGVDIQAEPKRVEYFTNMSNDLNDKIEAIRKKYAAERQKLFNKYQSPQRSRAFDAKLQEQKAIDRRRVSLEQSKAQTPHYRVFLEQHRNPHYGPTTQTKKSPLHQKQNYRAYEQLYSKKYERVAGINNQQESYLTKYDGIRGSLNATQKKSNYDRLGFYQPKKYAFQTTYSPYISRYGGYGRY